MIFSNNERRITKLESEIEELRKRLWVLERNTRYYTDAQLELFSQGRYYFSGVQQHETVALTDVVRKIAEHLKMSVNITQPTSSRIEVHFGETK
jgi:hypothetical protein